MFLHKAMLEVGLPSFLVCDGGSLSNAPTSTLDYTSFEALKPNARDVILFHHSFLDGNASRLLGLPCRKVMIYHNITPGHFFRPAGQGWLADRCDEGRAFLKNMNGSFDAVVGDSGYNAQELTENGFTSPLVIPVFYNDVFFSDGTSDNTEFLERRISNELNLVFIGRYVPNKRPDNLIRVVATIKNLIKLPVRLRLHGKIWDRGYFLSLRRLSEELGVESEINFELNQPQNALRTSLAAADAFVSTSEHEGFMVPLVEAFSAGCPVVALASSAVTETCGPAGCVIRTPNIEQVAGHIVALSQDRDLRAAIIRAQTKRAGDFSARRTLRKWDSLLKNFIDRPLVGHAHRI